MMKINNSAGIVSGAVADGGIMSDELKKEYRVLDKRGYGDGFAQIVIDKETRKPGDLVWLVPNSAEQRMLEADGWIELAEKPKAKVELEVEEEPKNKSSKKK